MDVVANKAHLFDMTVNGAKKEVSKKFVKDLFKMGVTVDGEGNLKKVEELNVEEFEKFSEKFKKLAEFGIKTCINNQCSGVHL